MNTRRIASLLSELADAFEAVEPKRKRVKTQKPLPLMLELVSLFTDPGDLILDPFCGSGTTGIAALRLGRRFVGIEKNESMAELARERIQADLDGSSLHASRNGQGALFA